MEMNFTKRFLDYKTLTSKKKSDDSYKTYKTCLNDFYNYITSLKNKEFNNDIELLGAVTTADYESYYKYLSVDKEQLMTTVNAKLNATKGIYKYLIDVNEGLVIKNPTGTIKGFTQSDIKEDREDNNRIKETLTTEEMNKLLLSTYVRVKREKNFDFNSARDRALLSVLISGGLRVGEALSIEMNELEVTEYGYVINIPKNKTKNNVAKRMAIPDSVNIYFLEYLGYRKKMDIEDHNYLFITKSNRKMDYSAAKGVIDKALEKASIEKKITSHCFRHSLAQIFVEKNVNISIIYKILGWKNDKMMLDNYDGKATDPKWDKLKFELCDILASY